MYAKYGSYQHDDNELELVSANHRAVYDGRGVWRSTVITYSLQGELIPSQTSITQAKIKTAIDALMEAYDDDGKDFILYHDDGTESSHKLLNSTSVSGVRVLDRSFPSGPGEYATARKYAITLEAEYTETAAGYVSFDEVVRFSGTGGPRRIMIETLNGNPVVQTTRKKTIQRISQSGTVVGWLAYPIVPAPLFGNSGGVIYHEDQDEIQRGKPEQRGRSLVNWPITYSYSYSSSVDKSRATPHLI